MSGVMHPSREVDIGGRTYSVHFNENGEPCCVEVHAICKAGGYCIAFRRIAMSGPTGRAAIAQATGQQGGAK